MNSLQCEQIEASHGQRFPRWTTLLVSVTCGLILSIILAWVSNSGKGISGWLSFFGILLAGSVIILTFWWLLKEEDPPKWLGMLLIAALLIRLLAATAWFTTIPNWGHGTQAEEAGYVMADAGARDQAAWKLSQSNRSLWSAFQGNRKVDQYGGLLFLSAFIYRYLGGNYHQPLLISLLTAILGTLAVLFTWGFTRLAWGEKEAKIAAWVIVLYPEAILLSSSQMREAFTMTFTIIAFYGLLRYRRNRTFTSIAWVLLPLLLTLPFSPPFSTLLFGILVLMGIAIRFSLPKRIFQQRIVWLIIILVVILVLAGLAISLKQFAPDDIKNPIAMASWWFRKSGQLQAYLSRHASGWLQKIFKATPEWIHFPILLGYGVVQPFLPAAIIVGSNSPIWRLISIWRSIGWSFILFFMIYAPILVIRRKDDQGIAKMLCLIVWIVILVASFRGGGDMWDNPRYRAMIAGLQAALVGWAWIEHRRVNDPWLRRTLISIVAIFAWFLPWYLRRYTALTWPIVDMFKTLGAGLATAFLLMIWDWTYSASKQADDESE